MRPVLALALVLLALTLALDRVPDLVPSPATTGERADRALELVVGAKGPLLPPGRIGTGPEEIGVAMRIGKRTLTAPGPAGLRVACIEPDLAVRGLAFHDVAGSTDARAALVASLARVGVGEVVVLASGGRIEPEGDRTGWDELEQTLADVGARARPGSATPESWALVTQRTERGWRPLAEGYSRDSGVALACALGPDAWTRTEARGELVLVHASGRRTTPLQDELSQASACTPGIAWDPETKVLGRRMPALHFPPGRLAWKDVGIAEGSALDVFLGIADGAPVGPEGLEFTVVVDEKTLASRRVLPGENWKPLEVDLRPFAGRTVTLELAVSGAAGGELLAGWPTLAAGFDVSPLQAWAESNAAEVRGR